MKVVSAACMFYVATVLLYNQSMTSMNVTSAFVTLYDRVIGMASANSPARDNLIEVILLGFTPMRLVDWTRPTFPLSCSDFLR